MNRRTDRRFSLQPTTRDHLMKSLQPFNDLNKNIHVWFNENNASMFHIPTDRPDDGLERSTCSCCLEGREGGRVEGVNDNEQLVFRLPLDRFRCVTVHSAKVSYASPDHFKIKLQKSIEFWRREKARAVWVHVDIEHSDLIPICTKLGFIFHHAKQNYLMLKLWLAKDEADNLPPYASQYLGCGGFVLNDDNEILVVKEKFHKDPHWKFPGGHAEPGEEISQATEREVCEETGISSEFQAVLCFRHQHDYKFGASDFYFVSLMRPTTLNIDMGANEISECKWMPLEEFLEHPKVAEFNRHIALTYLDHLESGAIAFQPRAISSFKSTEEKNLVYSVASLQPDLMWRERTDSENSDNTDNNPEDYSPDDFEACEDD